MGWGGGRFRYILVRLVHVPGPFGTCTGPARCTAHGGPVSLGEAFFVKGMALAAMGVSIWYMYRFRGVLVHVPFGRVVGPARPPRGVGGREGPGRAFRAILAQGTRTKPILLAQGPLVPMVGAVLRRPAPNADM